MATSQSDPPPGFVPRRSCAIELPIMFWAFKAVSPSWIPYNLISVISRLVESLTWGRYRRALSVTTVAAGACQYPLRIVIIIGIATLQGRGYSSQVSLHASQLLAANLTEFSQWAIAPHGH